MAGVISTDVRLFGELHRRFRNIYHLQYIIKCILIQVSHPQYLFFSADCVAEKPVKCSRAEKFFKLKYFKGLDRLDRLDRLIGLIGLIGWIGYRSLFTVYDSP